jgi:hypothetical protein
MKLNFPTYNFKVKTEETGNYVFDIIRKKFVALTPEEWVRQHLVWYLIHEKKFPASLISVEKGLVVNRLRKRFDLLVYNNLGTPFFLAECKSPDVLLSQRTFEQIAAYNMKFRVKQLLITNGLRHVLCLYADDFTSYRFLLEIPAYGDLI